MEKEKVEYLRRKIMNKDKDLEKYQMLENLIGRLSLRGTKTIYNGINGKKIVVDGNGDKYYIDLDLFPITEYGLSGYGNFTWGDITVEKYENVPDSVIREMINEGDSKEFEFPKDGVYECINYVQEKNLSRDDINTIQTDYKKIATDFYKKANRIYIANTANSRVALYEYEGRYYVSERRRLITADGYDVILTDQYSKKDELFEEVTKEEISEIFGEENFAKLNYGENIDTAILTDEECTRLNKTHEFDGHTFGSLIESQKDVKKLPEKQSKGNVTQDDIAKLSKDMQLTKTEVHNNFLTWLINKAKEIFVERN